MTYVTCPTTMPTSTLAWSSFRLSFSKSKTSQSHKNDHKWNRCLKVRCKMNQSDEIDRRNVLIGLGGLYTAANFPQPALSDPVQAPDLTKCGDAVIKEGLNVACCPPVDKIADFKLPNPTILRVRPASHLVNAKYLEKFEKAVQIMKNLPDTDPRSFYQQANIHCAYCNGAYDQVGFPDLVLQIHNSWLFFPWHRWYLYFFEKILGKLIDDPSFAMPFWNWDHPASMTIPAIYANSKSPLYDTYRDALHPRPTLMDLNYAGVDVPSTDTERISNNLALMYTQMISNAKKPDLFLGQPYRAGYETTQTGPGSLENSPHIPVHRWTGDPTQPNGEDMGNFYSAARDPIFMAHHSNIDRLWSVWRTLQLPGHQNFTDPDWLDTTFLFYDENAKLVKVKVRDCLDEKKLGYTNQPVENLWLDSRPKSKKTRPQSKSKAKTSRTILTATTQPIVLDKKAVTIKVSRDNKKRSKKEKDEKEEVLLIEGIELSTDEFVKFDVLVNDEDDGATFVGPNKAEFAGTFASLPHLNNKGKEGKIKTCLRLGISDLLEDLDVEDDESILVTLVPKSIPTSITISGVKIELQ